MPDEVGDGAVAAVWTSVVLAHEARMWCQALAESEWTASSLIVAEDIDATADTMVHALLERDAVIHRVNTAWFPAQLSVAAELRGERWTGQMRTPARVIDLEGITAVWYCTPRAYRFPSELSPAERGHANLEAEYGLGGVLSSLPALWVNHPSRLADAACKPVQLVTAARCGLMVPDTVITNEADTVREFAAAGKTVSVKLNTVTPSLYRRR